MTVLNREQARSRISEAARLTAWSEEGESVIFLPASLFIHSDCLSPPEVLLIPGTTRGILEEEQTVSVVTSWKVLRLLAVNCTGRRWMWWRIML